MRRNVYRDRRMILKHASAQRRCASSFPSPATKADFEVYRRHSCRAAESTGADSVPPMQSSISFRIAWHSFRGACPAACASFHSKSSDFNCISSGSTVPCIKSIYRYSAIKAADFRKPKYAVADSYAGPSFSDGYTGCLSKQAEKQGFTLLSRMR